VITSHNFLVIINKETIEMLNNHKLIIKNEDLVINKRYEKLSEIKDIIDPDKFPIFSLMY
jgi:hypothetical protein